MGDHDHEDDHHLVPPDVPRAAEITAVDLFNSSLRAAVAVLGGSVPTDLPVAEWFRRLFEAKRAGER